MANRLDPYDYPELYEYENRCSRCMERLGDCVCDTPKDPWLGPGSVREVATLREAMRVWDQVNVGKAQQCRVYLQTLCRAD